MQRTLAGWEVVVYYIMPHFMSGAPYDHVSYACGLDQLVLRQCVCYALLGAAYIVHH
jgi:hypothetical protein